MASIFDNPFGMSRYGFTEGDVKDANAQRQSQIEDFSGKLTAARQAYMAQIPQLNKLAFDQFGKDAAAHFAGTGLGADSGAFQESLARFALPLQMNMYDKAFGAATNEANAVNAARAGAHGDYMRAIASNMSAPTSNPFGGFLLGATVGAPGKALNAIGVGMGSQSGGAGTLPPTEAEQGMAMAA